MQSSVSKLFLLFIFIINVLFLNSFISCAILTIIIGLVLVVSDMDYKKLLKLKYFLPLFILGFISNSLLLILYKLFLILVLYIYYTSIDLIVRYNALYKVLKVFDLEKYTSNIILFIPTLKKEIKNIKFIPFTTIIKNTNMRLKHLSIRFSGIKLYEFKLNNNDYMVILLLILFYTLTIFA